MTVQQSLEEVLVLARKRWHILAIPVVLGVVTSIVVLFLLPPQYRAGTMILVESQKIPKEYVRTTVTTTVAERLRTIEQQIKNRSNLERIVNELGLYESERSEFGIESALSLARKNLELAVTGGSVFHIFFTSGDPVKAAATANRVAELFIQENLKRRADEARNTSSFLMIELSQIQDQLEEQESRVVEFRLEHAGRLPEDRDANIKAIEQLQRRLEITLDSIDKAELRQLVLEREVAQLRREQPIEEVPGGRSRLDEAREELVELRSQYTDEHPDVIRKLKEIQQLQGGDEATDAELPTTDHLFGRQLALREAELDSLEVELTRLEAEQQQHLLGLRRYQRNLEAIPRVEQELIQLTRDYDNLQNNYDSLLNKGIEARLAENLEQQRQSEQFTVLEKAVPPSQPSKPNRPLVLLLGLIGGLATGLVGAVLADQLDQTFRDAASLSGAFPQVSVLGVIHRIDPESQNVIDLLKKKSA